MTLPTTLATTHRYPLVDDYFNFNTPEFITHETLTPRETRGWRHLVFILRSTTP